MNDFERQLQCREIRLQVKKVIIIASLLCYNNSDVIVTLIIKNFHLYLILTAVVVIFPNRCYSDVVYICSNLGGIDPE